MHFASCLEVGEEVGSQLEAFQLSLCRGSLLTINITINRRYPSNLDCLRKTSLCPTRVCARQSPRTLSLFVCYCCPSPFVLADQFCQIIPTSSLVYISLSVRPQVVLPFSSLFIIPQYCNERSLQEASDVCQGIPLTEVDGQELSSERRNNQIQHVKTR